MFNELVLLLIAIETKPFTTLIWYAMVLLNATVTDGNVKSLVSSVELVLTVP